MASFGDGVTGTRDIFAGNRLDVVDTKSCGRFVCVVRRSEMDRKCVPGIHPYMPMYMRRCASYTWCNKQVC